MEVIIHRNVAVNGISMHVAEIGKGPVVLLLHGFPECWYTWRHQMLFLAAHGHRAVAPDLRGYGGTKGAPVNDPSKFTFSHVVGDLIGLLKTVAPEEEKVFLVGHDWGAMTAWALAQFRPDKVKCVFNMSAAFNPRSPSWKPIEALRAIYGHNYYMIRFQEPGEMEGEFAQLGIKRVLHTFLKYRFPFPLFLPKGWVEKASKIPEPLPLPPWLTVEDLDYYTGQYEQSGFTGALNFYRALDINWEETAPWTGDKIKVPAKFVVGDLDLTYNSLGAKFYIHGGGFKRDVPLLEDVVVIKGAAHFIHEEKPDDINKHLLEFLYKHSSPKRSML